MPPRLFAATVLCFAAPALANPPVSINAHIDNGRAGNAINFQFTAIDDFDPPSALVWSNLQFAGVPFSGRPAIPNLLPTLAADGAFHWDTTGSKPGLYTAAVTVTDTGDLTDTGLLTIDIATPEPSTFALGTMAMLALIGTRCGRR